MKFVLSKYRPIPSAEEFKIVGNVNVVNALNRCQLCATDPLQPSGSSLLFQHLSSSEMRSHLVNKIELLTLKIHF